MTKITFEDLPSTNTPLSASNLNTLQDNVETAINSVDSKTTYSTTETIVGTWKGKPLYRKVYEFTSLSGNYTIDSFNQIVSISGMIHRKDYDIYIPVNGRHNDSGWATSFGNIQGTGLAFIYGNSWNSTTFDKLTVIIEYTKTTD